MNYTLLDFVNQVRLHQLDAARKTLVLALNSKIYSLLESANTSLVSEMSIIDFSKTVANPQKIGLGKKEQEIKDNISAKQSGNDAIFINRSKEDLLNLIINTLGKSNVYIPNSSHYKLTQWKLSVDEV